MIKRDKVEIKDLAAGPELKDEELRTIVGAMMSARLQASTCCMCGGVDCD